MENKKTIIWSIVLFLIVVLMFIIIVYGRPIYKEHLIKRVEEFDSKWKPICENLGGLYLEFGLNHANNCYMNQSGVLVKTIMVELNGEYYLEGDCFIINKLMEGLN